MSEITAFPSVNSLVDGIITKLPSDISQNHAAIIRSLLQDSLGKSLKQVEFYRKLNEEMMSGIQNIYQQVSQVKSSQENEPDKQKTEELFTEASKHLDEIMITTENAASQILTIIEKQQDMAPENEDLIKLACERKLEEKEAERLIEINKNIDNDLNEILTALSFQDLTGQRIKKIITTLQKIETTAFQLFISTGLAMKAHAKEPNKDMETIQKEAKQIASELKGPSIDSNQKDVDDLLAQLGL